MTEPVFPPALVETAAEALYGASPWVHDGVEIPWDDLTALGRETFRDKASAVLVAVADPLRAEGWEHGRSDGYHDALRWNDPARCACDWTPTPNPYEES
jgi:hypothetical protein